MSNLLDLVLRHARIATAGRVVTPGGVDAHCHLDQPMPAPVRIADDFDTGTRAAACGGTTTVIPFAAQTVAQVVWDGENFHPRAGRGRFLRCGAPSLMPRTR